MRLLRLSAIAASFLLPSCSARLPSSSTASYRAPTRDSREAVAVDGHATADPFTLDEAAEVRTVTLSNEAASVLREDYLYSFEPTKDVNRWTVRRVMRRRLNAVEDTQQVEAGVVATAEEDEQDEANEESRNHKIKNVLISFLCIVSAAAAAGLTLGMMSLDPVALEIKRRASEDAEERRWSERLLPLLVGHSKRHQLLVSLLLLNSLANEALPIFLDELFPSKFASIFVSVTLVLFFGEIVPSAIFTGPNQVKLAASLVPLAKTFMVVLSPIATPIAKLLDHVLIDDDGMGEDEAQEMDVTEGHYYNRDELSALIRIQYEAQLAAKRRWKTSRLTALSQKPKRISESKPKIPRMMAGHKKTNSVDCSVRPELNRSTVDYRSVRHLKHSLMNSSQRGSFRGSLMNSAQRDSFRGSFMESASDRAPSSFHRDEVTIIEGALAMTTKVAGDIYTPLRSVHALPSDTVLDEDAMVEIWARGHSRVPVYVPSSKGRQDEYFADVSGIVGILLCRQLIVVNPEAARPLSTLPLAIPPCVAPTTILVDLINLFQEGGGRGRGGMHMALVCARPKLAAGAMKEGKPVPREAGLVGVITLEDVIEELLQEEIYDEADDYIQLARWGWDKWRLFVKRKRAMRKEARASEDTPLLWARGENAPVLTPRSTR